MYAMIQYRTPQNHTIKGGSKPEWIAYLGQEKKADILCSLRSRSLTGTRFAKPFVSMTLSNVLVVGF